MLTVLGGCYREVCLRPGWNQLFGSGVRAAAAVSAVVLERPRLVTFAADVEGRALAVLGATYGFDFERRPRSHPVEFQYDHPLSPPRLYPDVRDLPPVPAVEVTAEHLLAFSLIEAETRVAAETLVYDPQAGRLALPPSLAGARAGRLALVANLGEARALVLALGCTEPAGGHLPTEFGRTLLERERADVVVVKNGAEGATVLTPDRTVRIPSFVAPSVFSIGSGDVFSAVFAGLWTERGADPVEAATLASVATAHVCHTRTLPLPKDLAALRERYSQAPVTVRVERDRPTVYLAGPFWTLPQVWLLNEARRGLEEQGLAVFSPLHEVGLLAHDPTEVEVARVAEADLAGLRRSNAVLALLDGLDPGTLFEVGYARARGTPVVGLAEAVPRAALTMYEGSGCVLTDDFTTAVYRTGWEARRA